MKPRIIFGFSGKKDNVMHFESLSKCLNCIYFEKKIYVPTLPEIFRPVTRNTHIFVVGLNSIRSCDLNHFHALASDIVRRGDT